MSEPSQKVDRVEDTARWVAAARARESERSDAIFQDPSARKLAGPEGMALGDRLIGQLGGTWPIVARTQLIDRLVLDAVRDRADAVVNLAAGLDSRPYRMALPEALSWIEVDHPHVLEEKARLLAEDRPVCRLERIGADLANDSERRALFAKLGERFGRVLVITEGLLCYLPEAAALGLGKDLRAIPSVFRWVADLNNSAVHRHIAWRTRGALQGTAKMQFGPDSGPRVFEPLGWKVVSAASLFKTAGKLKRLPFPMSLFALLPEKPYGSPRRPWSGVCVFEPSA